MAIKLCAGLTVILQWNCIKKNHIHTHKDYGIQHCVVW